MQPKEQKRKEEEKETRKEKENSTDRYLKRPPTFESISPLEIQKRGGFLDGNECPEGTILRLQGRGAALAFRFEAAAN